MKLSEHFERAEFACPCSCGRDTVDAELVNVLELVREHFGVPVLVTSGHRCERHNCEVGGAPESQHLYGRAADIVLRGVPASRVQEFLHGQFPDRLGLGCYARFTHIDSRTDGPARW